MTETAVVTKQTPRADVLEAVIAKGDLAQLTPEQRVAYYKATCESLGLNPLTQPFQYISLNGKLTLYARKDATDQLRQSRRVSIVKLERDKIEGLYVVTAYAQVPDGRQDSAIGAVNIEGVKGDALANCLMKAETKAKRRVTLSICGLGWTDESEIETIPGAQPVTIEPSTGIIVGTQAKREARPEDAAWTRTTGAQEAFETYLRKSEAEPGDFYKFAGCEFHALPDKGATYSMVRDYRAARAQGKVGQ